MSACIRSDFLQYQILRSPLLARPDWLRDAVEYPRLIDMVGNERFLPGARGHVWEKSMTCVFISWYMCSQVSAVVPAVLA